MAESDKKRVMRLLSAIGTVGNATIEATNTQDVILLRLAGEKTLKCPKPLLRAMVREGWLNESKGPDATTVVLTEDGRSFVERERAGGSFAAQHRHMTGAGIGTRASNAEESPLARLARPRRGRAIIDRSLLVAGDRLRSDFEHAHMRQRVTASWEATHTAGRRSAGGESQSIPDRALDARARFYAAMDAVGPELSGVLVDVCCYLKGLEQVELERSWPRRSAKLLLTAALKALDRHYHPPAQKHGKSRHWGADDYRPGVSD